MIEEDGRRKIKKMEDKSMKKFCKQVGKKMKTI